uniref:Plectin/eS10 N-terminal domain-containing protein n=1 Tax=Erpetoichthys calabaricus TaxID=27687 RepID=A0A8C4SN71_ERPCA
MLMPLGDLKAIYELLFRDGVLVAKKDKRPQSKHPEIRGVTNLQVIKAMTSLKSRGYVRETYSWKHFYWYLNNEGIAYLRDYLKLPPEIVPSSLQRVRRPTAMLDVSRRAARVQTVEGSAISHKGGPEAVLCESAHLSCGLTVLGRTILVRIIKLLCPPLIHLHLQVVSGRDIRINNQA